MPQVGPSIASDIYTIGRTLAVLIMEFRGSVLWDFCEQWLDVSIRQAEMMEETDGEGDADGEAAPIPGAKEWPGGADLPLYAIGKCAPPILRGAASMRTSP